MTDNDSLQGFAVEAEFAREAILLAPSNDDHDKLLDAIRVGKSPAQRVQDFWALFYEGHPSWASAFDLLVTGDTKLVVTTVLSTVQLWLLWRHQAKSVPQTLRQQVCHSCRTPTAWLHRWKANLIRASLGDEDVLDDLDGTPVVCQISVAGLVGNDRALALLRSHFDSTGDAYFRRTSALQLARNFCDDGEDFLTDEMGLPSGRGEHLMIAAALANLKNPVGCSYVLALIENCIVEPIDPSSRSAFEKVVRRELNNLCVTVDVSAVDWPTAVVAAMCEAIKSGRQPPAPSKY